MSFKQMNIFLQFVAATKVFQTHNRSLAAVQRTGQPNNEAMAATPPKLSVGVTQRKRDEKRQDRDAFYVSRKRRFCVARFCKFVFGNFVFRAEENRGWA
jgi:hypothetical protein